MPVYTYVCGDCGEKFDLLIGVTLEKTDLKCTRCGSGKIKKILSSFSMGSSSNKSAASDSTCSTGMCSARSERRD